MIRKLSTIFLAAIIGGITASASEAVPTDTNGDGKVDKSDATLIYDFILGTADDSTTASQVDVNADGKVNTVDVVEVYRAIIRLGGVNVGDWNDGGTISGSETEETTN